MADRAAAGRRAAVDVSGGGHRSWRPATLLTLGPHTGPARIRNAGAAPGLLQAAHAQARRGGGIYRDHLRRILIALRRDPQLCAALQRVLEGETRIPEEEFVRLRAGGLLSGDSDAVRFRCDLYRRFFAQHLLADLAPGSP